jgi:TonB family protein
MKFCPKCQTKFDEEIIRFCTQDGSPLVEENPSFIAMPSQASFNVEEIDDIGEDTVITRNRPTSPPAQQPTTQYEEPTQRVIIPIGEDRKQSVKPLEHPQTHVPPIKKSNTPLVVFLTIFGTVAILGVVGGAWWLLQGQTAVPANNNLNTNFNVADNSNSGVNYNSSLPDFNINSSVNGNFNTNTNVNAANTPTKTPTPTPTKTPTPKPSPTVSTNTNVNSNTVVNGSQTNSNINSNRVIIIGPTPAATPKPVQSPTVTPVPSNVNVGVMNSRARELRKPAYPPIAKQMGASGQVVVQVSIDENGNVVAAKAVSGHMLLRAPAEAAARQSAFNPVKVGDKAIRANGTIVYNFINQ